MLLLTPDYVRLGVRTRTKEDAIRAAGRVLVDAGNIAPAYVDSMLGREGQANTYLGHGIAIPHGMAQDRDLILRTGVSVVQVPEGVEWNPGQTVRLVVGIAAQSDEHLGILSALTDLLDEPATAEQLAVTADPADIVHALARTPEAAACGTRASRRGVLARGDPPERGRPARASRHALRRCRPCLRVRDPRARRRPQPRTARPWRRC